MSERIGVGGNLYSNITCAVKALSGDIPFVVRDSANTRILTIYSNGNTVIGQGSGIAGDTTLTINHANTWGLTLVQGDARKPGGGSWGVWSDRRFKKNIHELDGSLDTLLKLRGVNFEYKDPESIHELPGVRTGFIAQEVEAVIPDWVKTGDDGYKSVTIRGFEALAVEAMRELKSDNDELRARIDSLESRLDSAGIGAIAKGSFTWPAAAMLGLLGVAAVRRRSSKA